MLQERFDMIKSISAAPSFKGYIPVKHFALYPKDNKYYQVTKRENLIKCQSFVVRNLNGTAKKMKNQEFIDYYRFHDGDYKTCPVVQSAYDNTTPTIYMITGYDTDAVKLEARNIGKAKREAIELTGNSETFESKNKANEYFRNINRLIRTSCRQVQAPNGDKLELQVYFIPKYDKDGKVKSFIYQTAYFAKDETK